MSADAAFAQLLDDVAADRLERRAAGRAGARARRSFVALGGALLHARLRPAGPAPLPAAVRARRGSSRSIALGALVALFAAFVALQFATLFGGERARARHRRT